MSLSQGNKSQNASKNITHSSANQTTSKSENVTAAPVVAQKLRKQIAVKQ